MPPRGVKPKPTALKILTGNPGKRPLNAHEPKPRAGRPSCPPHLSDEGKREWRRAVRFLEPLGLLTHLDRAALAGYCQAWGRWVEAEEALRAHGVLVKAPTGYPMLSPYLAIANKALEQVRLFLAEFGMTPSSRTRVTAVAQENPADDEFSRWLRG